jgi:hypothetical protein
MPKIVVTHAIHDLDRWLKGRDERAAAFPGGSYVTDLVPMDGSKQAAVLAEVDDLDGFRTFLSSMPPEVAAQAESHGVIPPFVVFVEA